MKHTTTYLLTLLLLTSCAYAAMSFTLVDSMGPTKKNHWIEVPQGYTIAAGRYFIADDPSKKHGFYSNETTKLGEISDGSIIAKYVGKGGNGSNTNRFNFFAVGNGTWYNSSAFAHFHNGVTIHRDGGTNMKIYRYNNNTQTDAKTCADFTPSTTAFEEYKLNYNNTNRTIEFVRNNITLCSVALGSGFVQPENFKFGIQNSNGASSSTTLYLGNLSYATTDAACSTSEGGGLSAGVTFVFRPTQVNSTNVIPTGQSSTKGALNITRTAGCTKVNITMNFTNLPPNGFVLCANSSTIRRCTNLTGTHKTIISNMTANTNALVWVYANYSGVTQGFLPNINVRGVQTT